MALLYFSCSFILALILGVWGNWLRSIPCWKFMFTPSSKPRVHRAAFIYNYLNSRPFISFYNRPAVSDCAQFRGAPALRLVPVSSSIVAIKPCGPTSTLSSAFLVSFAVLPTNLIVDGNKTYFSPFRAPKSPLSCLPTDKWYILWRYDYWSLAVLGDQSHTVGRNQLSSGVSRIAAPVCTAWGADVFVELRGLSGHIKQANWASFKHRETSKFNWAVMFHS